MKRCRCGAWTSERGGKCIKCRNGMTDEEMLIAKDILRSNGQYYAPDNPKRNAAVLLSKFEGGNIPLDTMIEKYIPPPVQEDEEE